jgi:hypothetical protein
MPRDVSDPRLLGCGPVRARALLRLCVTACTALYPLVTSTALRVTHCVMSRQERDGGDGPAVLLLASNPNVRCLVGDHFVVGILGAAAVLLFSLAVPLASLLFLCSTRRQWLSAPVAQRRPSDTGSRRRGSHSAVVMHNPFFRHAHKAGGDGDGNSSDAPPTAVDCGDVKAMPTTGGRRVVSVTGRDGSSGVVTASPVTTASSSSSTSAAAVAVPVLFQGWAPYLLSDFHPHMFAFKHANTLVLATLAVLAEYSGSTSLLPQVVKAAASAAAIAAFMVAVLALSPYTPKSAWKRTVKLALLALCLLAITTNLVLFVMHDVDAASRMRWLRWLGVGMSWALLAGCGAVVLVFVVAFWRELLSGAVSDQRRAVRKAAAARAKAAGAAAGSGSVSGAASKSLSSSSNANRRSSRTLLRQMSGREVTTAVGDVPDSKSLGVEVVGRSTRSLLRQPSGRLSIVGPVSAVPGAVSATMPRGLHAASSTLPPATGDTPLSLVVTSPLSPEAVITVSPLPPQQRRRSSIKAAWNRSALLSYRAADAAPAVALRHAVSQDRRRAVFTPQQNTKARRDSTVFAVAET